MLVPVGIQVDITTNALGTGYIGLSLDAPLPDNLSGTNYVIGLVNLIPFVRNTFATTVHVNVGVGNHYVVLGYHIPALLPGKIDYVKLVIRLAGQTITKEYLALMSKKYVYMVFTVGQNGEVTVTGMGEIAPGSAPILNPGGGGGLVGGDIGDVMVNMIGPLMEMMMPLMLMQAMISMITGLISSLMVVRI